MLGLQVVQHDLLSGTPGFKDNETHVVLSIFQIFNCVAIFVLFVRPWGACGPILGASGGLSFFHPTSPNNHFSNLGAPLSNWEHLGTIWDHLGTNLVRVCKLMDLQTQNIRKNTTCFTYFQCCNFKQLCAVSLSMGRIWVHFGSLWGPVFVLPPPPNTHVCASWCSFVKLGTSGHHKGPSWNHLGPILKPY